MSSTRTADAMARNRCLEVSGFLLGLVLAFTLAAGHWHLAAAWLSEVLR